MNQLIINARVQFRRPRREPQTTPSADPAAQPSEPPAPTRLPRITKLMALAIRLEQQVQEGTIRDYAEIARVGHVSRARITQILTLLQLAPDLQETLLFLPRVASGKDPITERDLRPIAATADWTQQRVLWRRAIDYPQQP
jgi:hypothetical protein